MTDFSQRKNTSTVQNRVAGVSLASLIVDPSLLPSFPAAGDTIGFFDLPPGARIVDAWIKLNQSVGAATSTLKLQAVPSGGGAVDLTATLAATAAGGNRTNTVPPDKQTVVTTIQALVGTANLNAAGNIEVGVLYSQA